jgi:UDP-2,3-diacylglucosamine pyrophosphatase LpxH
MGLEPVCGECDVRTLFVSDVHLGFRYAQPERFLNFLLRFRPEQLFILGDFLDGWKLRSAWRWEPVYARIFARLLQLARQGTDLYYTPGNHDAFLRCAEMRNIVESAGVRLRMQDEFVFLARDGRRFIVTHGDKFDVIECRYQWLSAATSVAYEPLLSINWWIHRLLRRHGQSPYAMCATVKDKVKAFVRFLSHFEHELFQHARSKDCDGVICGHIHKPGVVVSGEMTYFNTGDWVENCTALVEDHDGSIRLDSLYPHVPSRIVYSAGVVKEWDRCRRERFALTKGLSVLAEAAETV